MNWITWDIFIQNKTPRAFWGVVYQGFTCKDDNPHKVQMLFYHKIGENEFRISRYQAGNTGYIDRLYDVEEENVMLFAEIEKPSVPDVYEIPYHGHISQAVRQAVIDMGEEDPAEYATISEHSYGSFWK